MSESHIGFLYKAASTITANETNQTNSILRSYYLMRCMQITKGYGLPDKHFSSKTRCPHCGTEWGKNTEIKIKPVILSKRQKKRIKSRKPTKNNTDPKSIIHSNELVTICLFCKHSTISTLLKPTKEVVTKTKQVDTGVHINKYNSNKTKLQYSEEKKTETNIYCNAKEVFSLNNKNNSLKTNNIKIIKNNRKKKDKFAGLCQQAVLTSVKLKEAKNNNKLLSFLKSSSKV